MKSKLLSETKVRTGKVRLSYAHLFEPHAPTPEAKAVYSVSILIPKSDTETLGTIKQAIENAKEAGKHKRWGGKMPKGSKFHNPLQDGDVERPDDENYAEMYYVNAKSEAPPAVFSRQKERINDSTEVYSGCYAQASINFFPFSVSGNNGIGCGLNGVMKLEDGEALGGRGNVVNDFEFDEDFLE